MSPLQTDRTGNLRPIFDGRSPTFISDSTELVAAIRARGLPAINLTEVPPSMPEAVVLLAVDFAALPKAAPMLRHLRHSRLLWVPLASFAADLRSALYAFDLLLLTDFEDTVARNRDITSLFLSTDGPYRFSNGRAQVDFELIGPDASLATRTRLVLERGESTSMGFYTEVGMATVLADMDVPYHATGTFEVQGVLSARHRESPPELDDVFRRGREAAAELAARTPLMLEIDDNRIDPAGFGDLAGVLAKCTNSSYDWLCTELAFGTNRSIRAQIDWRYNSQFNEGVGGMHIALGDGLTGLHIDLVCPGGQLEASEATYSGFE